MKTPFPPFALLCAAFLGPADPVRAAPGDLDTTFGTGGKVTTVTNSSLYDRGVSVVVQSDGKIVVAANGNGSYYDFALVRYMNSGALDTSFGSGGKATTAIGSRDATAKAVALQSDGKIVVAGSCYDLIGDDYDFALVRYTATGALDTTFGGGTGIVTTDISGSRSNFAYGVAVQSDGKIVVAGYSISETSDIALVRYTATGALDTSFGDGTGKVTTAIGSNDDLGLSVAMQSDGKIVVAGYSNNASNADFALVRYTATGALDTSFGGGTGKVTTAIGSGTDAGKSVAVQSDGKIVVAGYSYNTSGNSDFALVRYTTTGALDTSFGGGTGKVTTAIMGSSDDVGLSVALQSDGKIVVAGYSEIISNHYRFVLVRYTATGALDTSFGGGTGKVTTFIRSNISETDFGYGVALQSDGKIVVAGYSFGQTFDLALVRCLGDPPDADADGLLDSWEIARFGNIAAHSALDDTDRDGRVELLEEAFGTDPLVPNAGAAVQAVEENGYLTMTVARRLGFAFTIESAGSPDASAFSAATTTVLLDDGSTLKARDNFPIATNPQRYLRVKVTAAP